MTGKWKTTMHDDEDTCTVVPLDDLTHHEPLDEDCVCGPRIEIQVRPGDPDGHIIIHHALDGRL